MRGQSCMCWSRWSEGAELYGFLGNLKCFGRSLSDTFPEELLALLSFWDLFATYNSP